MTIWDQFKSWFSGGRSAVTASGAALSVLTQRAFWVRLGMAFIGFAGIVFSMVLLFRRQIEGTVGTVAKAAVL